MPLLAVSEVIAIPCWALRSMSLIDPGSREETRSPLLFRSSSLIGERVGADGVRVGASLTGVTSMVMVLGVASVSTPGRPPSSFTWNVKLA